MQKIIGIFCILIFLYGCSGMKGLRRKNPTQLHKTIKKGSEWYYNDYLGHNENVKMIVSDKYNARISIPVKYSEDIEKMPSSKHLPEATQRMLETFDKNAFLSCQNCSINKQYFEIPIKYSKVDKGLCVFGSIFKFELTPFIALMALFSKEIGVSDVFSFPMCISTRETEAIKIDSPWNDPYKLAEVGINAYFKITPFPLTISCDNKACGVEDGYGNFVNELKVHKSISFDHNRLKLLLKNEKEDRERFWQQKRECPDLFSVLYKASQKRIYIDPVEQLYLSRRFVELNCGEYITYH